MQVLKRMRLDYLVQPDLEIVFEKPQLATQHGLSKQQEKPLHI